MVLLLLAVATLLVLCTSQQNDTWQDSWQDFGWIFVGGYHFSGTSVASRLVSTQPWAAGLAAESKLREKLKGCAKSKCKAPENEGVFFTSAFQRLIVERKCSRAKWGNSGECARETFETSKRLLGEAAEMRRHAWREWRRFIRADDTENCPAYIVEKDIDNLYRAPLLEAMFGKERASFVFTLRHPLARNQELELADIWLDAHRLVIEEVVPSLERIFVFQNERLRADPDGVLEGLAEMLQVDPFIFERGRRLFFHLDTIARDTGYIIIEPPKSSKMLDWNNLTKKEPAARERLASLDADLTLFCYSIYHTNALVDEHEHCRSPVFFSKGLSRRGPSRRRKAMEDNATKTKCDWPNALSLQRSARKPFFTVPKNHKKRGLPPSTFNTGRTTTRKRLARVSVVGRSPRRSLPTPPLGPVSRHFSSSATTASSSQQQQRQQQLRDNHRRDSSPIVGGVSRR